MLVAACGKKGSPTMNSFAKPYIVKDIRVVHRDARIYISWTYSNQQPKIMIKGFRIERAEGDGAYKTVASLPASSVSYSDADITINKEYRYRLLVFNARDVVGEASAELKVLPVNPPPPPEGLVFHVTNDAVEISWNKTAEGELFNVYRSDVKGVYPPAPLNEKPLDKPFLIESINIRKPVFYSIIAVVQSNMPNESSMSAELVIDSQTFVPAVPTDVRYVRSDSRGYISWKDSDETWVRGYRIYRKGTGGDFELLSEVNVPIYLDEDPVKEQTAYYVTAVGPGKESLPSATVRVKQ
jgi:hypothetical protein